MTTKECLFCASSERGGGALKATGRTQTRPSRFTAGYTFQRYQLACVTCGYLWWFAGRWAAEKYQAWKAEHPDVEPSAEPPAPSKQPLLPGASVRQAFTSTGALAKEWKLKAAGDHEDVA